MNDREPCMNTQQVVAIETRLETMEHRFTNLESDFEELASAVMGPRRTILAGGGRQGELGLVYQVADLRRMIEPLSSAQANGGIKANLPLWKVGAGILTTAITTGGAVWVALINSVSI